MKQEEEGDDEEEEEKPKTEEKEKKEPKKDDKKKEEPKKQIIDTKKSLSPMFDVPKEKEEEEKNRLNKVVTDRLNEYRAALDYFQNNELGEQRVDAINKAKLICIELKKIQDGKWK
jgi:outer membrane biosynthesis protein TonB